MGSWRGPVGSGGVGFACASFEFISYSEHWLDLFQWLFGGQFLTYCFFFITTRLCCFHAQPHILKLQVTNISLNIS